METPMKQVNIATATTCWSAGPRHKKAPELELNPSLKCQSLHVSSGLGGVTLFGPFPVDYVSD